MINARVLAPICDFLSRCRGGLTRGFIEREAFGFSMQNLLVRTILMDAEHRELIISLPDSPSSLQMQWWLHPFTSSQPLLLALPTSLPLTQEP